VAAFGMACFRRDYDELVVGPFRSVLGTAEGFCINQCFVRALGWAQANMYDPEMCFVFEQSTSRGPAIHGHRLRRLREVGPSALVNVAEFMDFTLENDPHGEHDFLSIATGRSFGMRLLQHGNGWRLGGPCRS